MATATKNTVDAAAVDAAQAAFDAAYKSGLDAVMAKTMTSREFCLAVAQARRAQEAAMRAAGAKTGGAASLSAPRQSRSVNLRKGGR